MRKRKLIEPTYWVYVHSVVTDSGVEMHYVGISQLMTKDRWRASLYKNTALEPFIKQYGWDSIEHTVVAYCSDKRIAMRYEDAIMKEFANQGTLINKRCSGGFWCENPVKRQRKYAKANRYRIRKRQKEYYSTPEGKIYNRVAAYNRYHDPIETPIQAKTNYLKHGIIPQYIKRDDL